MYADAPVRKLRAALAALLRSLLHGAAAHAYVPPRPAAAAAADADGAAAAGVALFPALGGDGGDAVSAVEAVVRLLPPRLLQRRLVHIHHDWQAEVRLQARRARLRQVRHGEGGRAWVGGDRGVDHAEGRLLRRRGQLHGV